MSSTTEPRMRQCVHGPVIPLPDHNDWERDWLPHSVHAAQTTMIAMEKSVLCISLLMSCLSWSAQG